MSDICKLETLKDFDSMTPDALNRLDEEISRIEKAHGSDKKSISAELKEVLAKFIDDEKYSSVRIIQDKIKTERAFQRIFVKGNFKKTASNLLNLLEGNNSVDTTYRTFATKYTNQIRTALKREGLEDQFFSGEFDRQIFEEIHRLANDMPSVASSDVKRMAKTLKKVNNQIHADMVSAGLDVKYRKDFLISRNYDVAKMMEAGKETWMADMKEQFLDMEATFNDSALKEAGRVDQILSDMYDDIVKSRRIYSIDDMVGKTNALTKLKGRKLEFKSGEVEYDFHQKYGNGKRLGEAIETQVDRSAKAVANVSMLGTVSEETIKRLKARIEESFEGKIDKNEMLKRMNKVDRAFLEVVAPPHQPSTALQKSVNMVRGLQAFSKLGSSLFTALYDINLSALQYSVRTGENQFVGYAKAFVTGLKSLNNNAARKEIAEMLNVNTWFNDAAVVLGGHKGDYDTGFDKVNRFFTKAQKLTGVPFQTEHSRIVNAVLQSEAFGKMLNNIDNLNAHQKIALKQYDLSVDDLKFIKKHAKPDSKTGLITPMTLMEIDPVAFGSNKKQMDMFTKYANYIDDAVQKGTPTPTAKVKRQLFKGRDQDENIRAVSNLVMQFKETAWQILLANKEALEIHHQAGGVTGASMAVSQYMMLGMVSYMGIETTKAILFNQDTPWDKLQKGDDESMRQLFFDYMAKSSVAPVLMDAVDQGTSPYFGNNITSFVAGPTLGGMVPDAFNIAKSSKKGRAAKRFAKKNLLPSNLIPYKAAERSLFEYDLIMGEKIRK